LFDTVVPATPLRDCACLVHLRKIRPGGSHRPRQFRLGRGDTDIRGRRIEIDQRLPRLHHLRIVGMDRGHLPRIACGDRDDVARDIRVVGLLLGRGEQEVEHRPHDRADHHDHTQDRQRTLATLRIAGRCNRLGSGGSLRIGHRVTP